MAFLYSLSIRFYGLILHLAAIFNKKAKLWVAGRKDPTWREFDFTDKNVCWFHCASLGEFDQGLPLMKKWKEKNPNDFIFVTFFSPSGMQFHHKRNHNADLVDYIPLDTRSNAKDFIAKVNPKTVIFVKYEFWRNHLHYAKSINANIYSVSALFRKSQTYFKPSGSFFRSILKNFNHVFVQDQISSDLLTTIEINHTIAGDLRFDRVNENKKCAEENSILKAFCQDAKVLIAGSTWTEDESVILPIINKKLNFTKVILAPHEIQESHLKQIESGLKIPFIRYTNITSETNLDLYNLILLDTIGHLSNAYQYGHVAYIGGAFKGSLHNILEPAVFGLPVVFGPFFKKFPEGRTFIDQGFGKSISNSAEFEKAISEIQSNRDEIKKKLQNYMTTQIGVADKIMAKLEGF